MIGYYAIANFHGETKLIGPFNNIEEKDILRNHHRLMEITSPMIGSAIDNRWEPALFMLMYSLIDQCTHAQHFMLTRITYDLFEKYSKQEGRRRW